MTGPGPALQIVGHHEGTASPGSILPHVWQRERFPVISDLEIVVAHDEADGIQLVRTFQATIHSVSVRRCRYGIHLVERNRNFLLSSSHIFDGLDSGVFFDHCNLHQVNIVGNHISYNRRAGIRQLDGDVHNIQITGNDIEYNSGDELVSAEILLEVAQRVYQRIRDRQQHDPSHTGLAGSEYPGARQAGIATHLRAIMTITGNVIGSRYRNLDISHATRVTITGNTIYGGTDLNVSLAHCSNVLLGTNTIGSRPSHHDVAQKYQDGVLLKDCQNCQLTGNLLSQLSAGTKESGGSITLEQCQHISVTNCQILQPLYRGIFVTDCVACQLSGNMLTNVPPADSFLQAIEVTGQSRDVFVQNNFCPQ